MCVCLQVHIYVYISVIFKSVFGIYLGFPDGSVGKNPPAMQETLVRFLDWKDPLEKG